MLSAKFFYFRLSFVILVVILGESVTVCSVPTAGLVAFYPFNGNADDESEHGNHGELDSRFFTVDRFGNLNAAARFNGDQDMIRLPYSVVDEAVKAQQYAVSFWAKIACWSPSSCQWNSYRMGLQYKLEPLYQITVAELLSLYKCAVDPLELRVWYHIALSYGLSSEPKPVELFLNGIRRCSIPSSGIRNYLLSPEIKAFFTFMFTPPAPGTEEQYAKIDDLRIYNHSLSPAEITELYTERNRMVYVFLHARFELQFHFLLRYGFRPFLSSY